MPNLLITGGLGFIGSGFIRYLLRNGLADKIINLDAMTYAADPANLEGYSLDPRYQFVRGDINDRELVCSLLEGVDVVVHFAAETHVDRSIESAAPFLMANVMGTVSLLEAVRKFPSVHFHHISTDEVYGSLGSSGHFSEESNYRPNSPYSASKAASDHFVRAYANTYGLSVTLSHCSNNYGPGQHEEKFIPLMISHCLEKKILPVYGNGTNVRDWIYVDDHAEAVWAIIQKGRRGETYDIGGKCELSNLELLHLLIEAVAKETGENSDVYRQLIRFVTDRPGHDFRYAIDSTKIERELRFFPRTNIADGLKKTIESAKKLDLK